MRISVVISTHNQRERTRLVLSALRRQEGCPLGPADIVVVDDGSTDGTADMLADVVRQMPLAIVRLDQNRGRCLARNIGVASTRGDLVAFLDGDAMPHPRWLAELSAAYRRSAPNCVVCGFQRSLPDLEYMQDPQTATPIPGVTPSVVREFLRLRRDQLTVTEEMIHGDFALIHDRSMEGGYPFPQLRALQEQTVDLLTQCPDARIGWVAFYPHNGLVPKEAFLQAGGFSPHIPFSEGWDLAYRLRLAGCRLVFAEDAITYHLYHYHDFSDPARARAEAAKRRRALRYMADGYDDGRLVLHDFWIAGIWPDPLVPADMVIPDLIEYERLYRDLDEEALEQYRSVALRHPQWRAPDQGVPA